MSILIVEDDADLALGLRNNLEIEGYSVDVAVDGPAALELLNQRKYEVVTLDLMLPGMDGLSVLRVMRERGDRTPVLILTARGREEDKVRGLRMGADDYMTKPFGVLEYLARIEALLRRTKPQRTELQVAGFGSIVVDPVKRQVTRAGAAVLLTPKEYELLWALIEANGAIRSRAALMQQVWGYETDVLSRTVDTHIAELRRKLESDPSLPFYLLTIRKAGYRLRRDGE